MVKVSVIIPCYNQGKYLEETVDSVLKSSFQDFEIVIINDGSTEEYTNELLRNFERPKTKVITSKNGGLSAARNLGIASSTGEYILPLDSDDLISSTYIEQTVQILDADNEVKIVYCNGEYFEEKTGLWETPEFEYANLLESNQFFCTAFFRREDFNRTNGYNPNMKYGAEDWDFWLSLLEWQWGEAKLVKIQEVHFYYRVREGSMVRSNTREQADYLRKRLFLNHPNLYAKYFPDPINLKHLLGERDGYIATLEKEKHELIIQNYELEKEVVDLKSSRVYNIGRYLKSIYKERVKRCENAKND